MITLDQDRNGTLFLKVRPYGLTVRIDETEEVTTDLEVEGVTVIPSDQIRYKGVVFGMCVDKNFHQSEVEFCLPRIDEHGFFRVGGTLYMICYIGKPDPWKPLEFGQYYFMTKEQVAGRVMEYAFARAFTSFFFNNTAHQTVEVNNVRLQVTLLSRFVTHTWVRQVRDTPIYRGAFRKTLLLYMREDGIRVDPYIFPKDLLYKVDPMSTSASGTVNRTFQLAQGAKIVDGRIEKGTSVFCEFTNQNGVGLMLSPKRANLLRAAVMNSMELTHAQARPVFHRFGLVQTRNLLTAVMDLGIHTYEDAIAISASAAVMMEGQDLTRVVAWSKTPLELVVQEGDMIQPQGILAKRAKGIIVLGQEGMETPDGEPEMVTVTATNLREDALLEKIEVCSHWHTGQLGVRTIFTFRSFVALRTGDKITGFSGCKGVVRVLPDDEMPVLPDGRIVELCVSPLSIAKRLAISSLLEMVIGEEYRRGEFERIELAADKIPKPFSWAAMKGVKSRLTYKGKELPNTVYVGTMPWMRIAKIPTRVGSAVGTDRPLTGEGMLPDTARTAGQRLDPSKGLTMLSRGLRRTVTSILGDSLGGDIMINTVAAIEAPARTEDDQSQAVDPEGDPGEQVSVGSPSDASEANEGREEARVLADEPEGRADVE